MEGGNDPPSFVPHSIRRGTQVGATSLPQLNLRTLGSNLCGPCFHRLDTEKRAHSFGAAGLWGASHASVPRVLTFRR